MQAASQKYLVHFIKTMKIFEQYHHLLINMDDFTSNIYDNKYLSHGSDTVAKYGNRDRI